MHKPISMESLSHNNIELKQWKH